MAAMGGIRLKLALSFHVCVLRKTSAAQYSFSSDIPLPWDRNHCKDCRCLSGYRKSLASECPLQTRPISAKPLLSGFLHEIVFKLLSVHFCYFFFYKAETKMFIERASSDAYF